MTEQPITTTTPSRRRFLAMCGLGAGGLTGAGVMLNRGGGDGLSSVGGTGSASPISAAGSFGAPSPVSAADPARRKLVIVELSGGNDGLATLIPMGDGRIHDLRPGLLPEEEVLWLDDRSGLHPALTDLAGNVAVLQGVGTPNPSGSHFESERRWWAGQTTGEDLPTTGFLGRLCDSLDSGAPVTGVAMGQGMSLALQSERSVTLGIPDTGAGWFLTAEDKWFQNLRNGLRDLGTRDAADGQLTAIARDGIGEALNFAAVLGRTEPNTEIYPGGALSDQLAASAALLALDEGVRVIHVQFGGFDTHGNQRGTHGGLMRDLNAAIGAFLDDLDDRDMGGEVLVATTSEFGRRPAQNDDGSDHGAASVAMLAGPVRPGLHGEPLALDRLDDDDNLIATTMFDQYYATLAESWFGVPASEVLPGSPRPLDGLIAT